MNPTSHTASSKDVGVSSPPRRRRWPALWTLAFAVSASLLLWVGIFVVIGWVLSLTSPNS
jgi:hypothetical protein